jgi:hypothetical protein
MRVKIDNNQINNIESKDFEEIFLKKNTKKICM